MKVLVFAPGYYHVYCPGCDKLHVIWTRESGLVEHPIWQFNGDVNSPTFTPSVKIETGHHPEASDICHFTITAGMIQYHGDCTHEFKGQILPLQDV